MIKHASVLKRLSYDPEAGILYWRLKDRLSKAGSQRKDGYVTITFGYQTYYAHQLIWFYVKGVWPQISVDHVNGVRYDNSWLNLRLANRQQQVFNQKGIKGYYFDKSRNKYRTIVRLKGKAIYGRSCDTEGEAIMEAEKLKKIHHGDFYHA